MENFELLYQCYLSGQMSEMQWQLHLKCDEGLQDWYKCKQTAYSIEAIE
jgi:hypothetical protein